MTEEANQDQPNGGDDNWGPEQLRKELGSIGAALAALPESIVNAHREAFPTKTADTTGAQEAQTVKDDAAAPKEANPTGQAQAQYKKGWMDKFWFGE